MKVCYRFRRINLYPPTNDRNYMPTGPEIELNLLKFTYGPKQTQPSESESQSSEFDTCESNMSTEPSELVSEPVVNESNVECQPKVWSDAPIIEEYESDSEDECVSIPTKQQETPSFANQQVKTPRENVKSHFTHSQKPKVDKKDLGYGFAIVWELEIRACLRSRALTKSFNSATYGNIPELEETACSGQNLATHADLKICLASIFSGHNNLHPRIPRWELGAIVPYRSLGSSVAVFVEIKAVCIVVDENLKQIPTFDYFELLETISAIENALERRGIATMHLYNWVRWR
ncbi:hypothetical protein Tco_0512226 [Tanacetum coccineum]